MRTPLEQQRRLQRAYDASASSFEGSISPATRARLRLMDRAIVDHLGASERALELGAGTGRLLRQIRARSRVALDLSPAMCQLARARGLAAVQADQLRIPFADAAFDALGSGYGASRHAEPDLWAMEAARVLADEGRFGLHLFAAAPRGLQIRPRPAAVAAPLDVSDLPALRERFARAGLWIERVRMIRNLPIWPYALPLRTDAALPLATHLAVLGVRMRRAFQLEVERLRAKLQHLGVARVVVGGGSMRPSYEFGEIVQVVASPEPRPGDVALILSRGAFVLHRLRARWGPHFLQAGDAPAARPALLSRWRILGIIPSRSRYWKRPPR